MALVRGVRLACRLLSAKGEHGSLIARSPLLLQDYQPHLIDIFTPTGKYVTGPSTLPTHAFQGSTPKATISRLFSSDIEELHRKLLRNDAKQSIAELKGMEDRGVKLTAER